MVTVIGITGLIGSGKSSVIKILDQKKISTLTADRVIDQLYQVDRFIKKKISFLNKKIYENDSFKKTELVEFCSNEEDLESISKIIHPYFFLYCKNWIFEKKNNKILFIEIPLLFESKYERLFNRIISVFSNPIVRKRRLFYYRKLVMERIIFFFKIQQKKEKRSINMSHIILNNNKNFFVLRKNIDYILLLIE